jgi:hypothetical protein
MPKGDYPGGTGFSTFQVLLLERVIELAKEWARHQGLSTDDWVDWSEVGQSHFVMPVGLLMVIDEANGGDAVAQELVRRFHLLHQESGNIIDFYFLGWEWVDDWDRSKGIRFSLSAFDKCRTALKRAGVRSFGGNADLILVDAHHWFTLGILPRDVETPSDVGPTGVTLDFNEALHINLSSRSADGELPPLGELLQAIIEAADAVRSAAATTRGGITFAMSDRLGVAIAKRSFLKFFLEKFGAMIGATKLANLAVRNLGPAVRVEKLTLEGTSASALSTKDT